MLQDQISGPYSMLKGGQKGHVELWSNAKRGRKLVWVEWRIGEGGCKKGTGAETN
jgi:hypothetical protein